MMDGIKASIVASVVFVVLVVALIVGGHSETPDPCMDDEARERVRNIIISGIDDALKEQVRHVFEIWMKDDTEQPKRAIKGMHIGIRAYVNSRAAALRWSPPLCPKP